MMKTIFTAARIQRLRRDFSSSRRVAEIAGVDPLRLLRFDGGEKKRRLNSDELERVAGVLGVPVESIADSKGYPVMAEIA